MTDKPTGPASYFPSIEIKYGQPNMNTATSSPNQTEHEVKNFRAFCDLC